MLRVVHLKRALFTQFSYKLISILACSVMFHTLLALEMQATPLGAAATKAPDLGTRAPPGALSHRSGHD